MGSPWYISPEQLRSTKSVDGRADLWSLGVVLHELLTGRPTFAADTLPQLCTAILHDAPTLLTASLPPPVQGLDGVIRRCLAKDPAERFGSAAELARALAPFAPRRSQVSLERIARMGSAPLDATLPADRVSPATLRAAQASLAGESKGLRGLWPFLGPAFIAAVAYIDPGNFATNIAGGAKYGYLLLWVVLAANLMAMLVQTLSAKLGIATGRNLPETCRDNFSRPVSMALWVQAEAIAMATDLAEVLGAALGLHLLFGMPLFPAGLLAGAGAFGILALLIGWYLVLKGTMDIIISIAGRGEIPLWGLLLASGIAQLLIGIWAVGYPGRSAWLLILWVGLGALMRGITEIVIAGGLG